MIKVFAADLLAIDIIVSLAGNPTLEALVKRYQLAPGGKANVSETAINALADAAAGYSRMEAPGGSSANMLATLAKLLGKEVAVQFLGIADDTPYGRMIRSSLEEAGITLLPETLPPGIAPRSALSYVIVFGGGERSIATWPGNARDILTPAMITGSMVENCDVALVQGSLWHKFGRAFAGRLIELCRQYLKELWLTLPTQADFSADDAAHFRSLMPYAAVLLGNAEELQRVLGLPAETSLEALRKEIGQGQVAFITTGGDGGVVITAQGIERAANVPVKRIANTLGAGDTAYAGFIAGYLKGLPYRECAHIAMLLAAEKLKVNGPRLADPKAILKDMYSAIFA